MFVSKLALPRRTFLRGIGATLALPLLDAMVPALTAQSRSAARPLRRLGFVYMPNGVARNFTGINYWTPLGEGSSFEFSPILKPLEPFRDRMVVVSGLAQHQADAHDDGANGDHTRGTSSWLTGVHPKRTEGADIRNGISADQIAAVELGKDTALPSLELAIDLNFLGRQCENSYACAYMNTLSWSTATTPLPTENNPRIVFERLFGDGGTSEQRLARARENRSILDSVMADLDRLQKGLGPSDRTKVADYVDSVREVERRIQRVEQRNASDLPDLNQPPGIPERFDEHVKLMYELQWLAYRADVTRVITFMLGRELNFRTYPEIGITEGHHESAGEVRQAGHLSGRAFQLVPREAEVHAGRGRHAARSLAVPLWRRVEQPESPRPLRPAARPRWQRCRPAPRRPPHRLQAGNADDEPAAVDAGQGWRAGREAGRQYRPSRTPLRSLMRIALILATVVFASVVASGQASLIEAARRGDAAAVRGLLTKKANINAVAADGTTALHWAVQRDDLPMVDALLKAGANAGLATRHGVTPLQLAATNGSALMITRLLDGGADPNTALPDGETVLMTASRTGAVDAVRALLDRGADYRRRHPAKGQTALMWAAAENNAGVVKLLVERGADVKERSSGGAFSPYLFAVRGGHIGASLAFIDAGVQVDEALPDGTTALLLAVINAHYELASVLLERGANPSADGQGWTALHQIAWSRRHNAGFNLPGPVATGGVDSLELVRKLVAKGADVNARQKKEPRDRSEERRVG